MRGPGGGGRGGGFGRSGGGGSRGGGFGRGPSGGGFGGHRPPHHHHHHHHHMPFFFGFRRPYYGYGYGGGCFSGLLGLMVLPVILIVVAVSLVANLIGSVGTSFGNIRNGGSIVVDYDVMEDYALAQYDDEFADAPSQADNILLLFLVDENCEDFQTIAIVGSNVRSEIDRMFGNETTAYGTEIMDNINPNYENSLSKNLAAVVDRMNLRISSLGLSDSFIESTDSPADYQSHLVNRSNLQITDHTVNRALLDFTESTNIPITIVVDDYDDVFERRFSVTDIFTIILAIGLAGVAVYFFVKAFKSKKESDDNYESGGRPNFEGTNSP